MWERIECSIKPAEVDKTSSNTIVYVRKNIEYVDATESKDAHWEADEQRIPYADWGIYEGVIENTMSISDVEDALMELADLIGEV